MKLNLWRDQMVDGEIVEEIYSLSDEEYGRMYLGPLRARIEIDIPAWPIKLFFKLKGRLSHGDR